MNIEITDLERAYIIKGLSMILEVSNDVLKTLKMIEKEGTEKVKEKDKVLLESENKELNDLLNKLINV